MYVLGIDIGTTGTKSMLLDRDGEIVGSAYKGYRLTKPGINMVEQRADDWWHAVVHTVRECIKGLENKRNIVSLSLSTQGGCLLSVNARGEPISDAISWMDTRSIEQQRQLLNAYDNDFFYAKTGWRLNPSLNLCKIKWLQDTKNAIYGRTHKLLSTVDYINFKLTGSYAIDPSNAAMTQLMNIQKKAWDNDLLVIIGLKQDKLPEIAESGTVIGNLTREASGLLGLDPAVKVVSGGHDQYCAAIGCEAFKSGEIFLSAGTAWVILGITEKPLFDNKSYIAPGPHIVNGLWGALASIYSAGVSMEWFRNNFALKKKTGRNYEIESYGEIDRKASKTMNRTKGLMFYPHFNGSGFPDWDYKSRASLVGLGFDHDRYDIARAVMEACLLSRGVVHDPISFSVTPASGLSINGSLGTTSVTISLIPLFSSLAPLSSVSLTPWAQAVKNAININGIIRAHIIYLKNLKAITSDKISIY